MLLQSTLLAKMPSSFLTNNTPPPYRCHLSAWTSTDDGLVESKPAAEECFEEQEMGSLPVIKVPNSAPASAWHMAHSNQSLCHENLSSPMSLALSRCIFPQQISNNSTSLHIKIPGQDYTTTVYYGRCSPEKQSSKPRRFPRRYATYMVHLLTLEVAEAEMHRAASRLRGLDNASVSSSPNSSGRGNRGGRGGYGSNWNRHVSTPVHT
jgi:hypothetical protein